MKLVLTSQAISGVYHATCGVAGFIKNMEHRRCPSVLGFLLIVAISFCSIKLFILGNCNKIFKSNLYASVPFLHLYHTSILIFDGFMSV